jgi:hypothetical protein
VTTGSSVLASRSASKLVSSSNNVPGFAWCRHQGNKTRFRLIVHRRRHKRSKKCNHLSIPWGKDAVYEYIYCQSTWVDIEHSVLHLYKFDTSLRPGLRLLSFQPPLTSKKKKVDNPFEESVTGLYRSYITSMVWSGYEFKNCQAEFGS